MAGASAARPVSAITRPQAARHSSQTFHPMPEMVACETISSHHSRDPHKGGIGVFGFPVAVRARDDYLSPSHPPLYSSAQKDNSSRRLEVIIPPRRFHFRVSGYSFLAAGIGPLRSMIPRSASPGRPASCSVPAALGHGRRGESGGRGSLGTRRRQPAGRRARGLLQPTAGEERKLRPPVGPAGAAARLRQVQGAADAGAGARGARQRGDEAAGKT